MRSLQAREGEDDLQAETKSMPQSESEEVAETDRTKIKGGYAMRHVSIVDRIKEHKTTIIQIVVVVAIVVVVSAIMTPMLAPSKSAYNTAIASLQSDMVRVGAHINTLGTNLTDQITALKRDTSQIGIIGTTTATNSHDIDTLQAWVDGAEARITTVEAQNSLPEGYLTGTVGNYTLHAKCSEAGNFTANVHLVYSPPVISDNTSTQDETLQAFYGSINWTAPMVRDYVPTLTYNSTAWQVSQVWFNIGTFAMTANNETAVDIIFSGLNSTYNPDFAYVEVWPVLK